MALDIIDMHIHFGAPEDKASGCYWSKEFEKSVAYIAILLFTQSLFKKVDIRRVEKHLFKVIYGSRNVNRSVLLAMDQVYDVDGQLRPDLTHLHVPNNYIAKLASKNDRILVGASIHPYRKDWEAEFDRCLEYRSVLCKWIPSSQMIDPDHELCEPFYEKLVAHNMPLLVHAGPEYAIPTSDKKYNRFNNPKYLSKALDYGVTVIMAHCALPYFWLLDVEYQEHFDELLRLFEEAEEKDWNLYADVSAITGPLRLPYIKQIQEDVPQERLLFGSDYPIPLSELSYNKSTNFLSWLRFILKVIFMKNPLDKNYEIVRGMGFDETIFTNPAALFKGIRY